MRYLPRQLVSPWKDVVKIADVVAASDEVDVVDTAARADKVDAVDVVLPADCLSP